VISVRELHGIQIGLCGPTAGSRPSRGTQYLDEAAAAIGAPHDRPGVADDAHSILSHINIIEARIKTLSHLIKRLSVVVRPRDESMRTDYPDIIAVIEDRVDPGIRGTGLNRLQFRPSLLRKRYSADRNRQKS
jgi:hypothetical protein